MLSASPPTCLLGPARSCISHFYPAEASKAAIQPVCVSPPAPTGSATRVCPAPLSKPSINQSSCKPSSQSTMIVKAELQHKPKGHSGHHKGMDHVPRKDALAQLLLHKAASQGFLFPSIGACPHQRERDRGPHCKNNKILCPRGLPCPITITQLK